MHGLIRRTSRRRQRASARRHFHYGCRAAAARAFTAAEIYLDKRVPSLAAAAMHCGSNVQYVQAAIVLIQDETALHPQRMRQLVLEGRVPLLAAAREARRRQKAERVTVEEMVASWRCWTPGQRANFGRAVGVAEIWDDAIEPVISEERGELAHAIAAE
jgi:hypothetical protein